MQLVLSEDQELLAKTAADFVADHSPVSRMRALRDANDPRGFSRWMDVFYREFRSKVQETMLPALASYADQIVAAAIEEVGADLDIEPEIAQFVTTYAGTLGLRHAISSQRQLQSVINASEADILADELEGRLVEWEEKRPDKIAMKETVKADSALSKLVWIAAGVTVLKWVANADACPLCQEMDGRTVSITRAFLAEGDTVDPKDGKTNKLESKQIISHPPLHGTCVCNVTPG